MFGIISDVFRTASRTNVDNTTHADQLYHHEARKLEELRRQNDLKYVFAKR